jgi:hypothetical protein
MGFLSGWAICLLLAPTIFAESQSPASAPTDQAASGTTAVIPLAEQPSKEQLAKLIEVMQLRKLYQNSFKAMQAMMQQQVQAQAKEMAAKATGSNSLSPEQQAAIEKLQLAMMEKVSGLLSVDEMIDDMASAYQRHLSRSDVDAMIAFYSSPAGKHLLEQQPIIMQEYMPVVMKRLQERMKPLLEEQKKAIEEIRKSAVPKEDKLTVK